MIYKKARLLLETFFFKLTRRENKPHNKSKNLHISVWEVCAYPGITKLVLKVFNPYLIQLTQLVNMVINESLIKQKSVPWSLDPSPSLANQAIKLSGFVLRQSEWDSRSSQSAVEKNSFCADGGTVTFLLWTLNDAVNVKAPSGVPGMSHEWCLTLGHAFCVFRPWKGRYRVSKFGNLRRKL